MNSQMNTAGRFGRHGSPFGSLFLAITPAWYYRAAVGGALADPVAANDQPARARGALESETST